MRKRFTVASVLMTVFAFACVAPAALRAAEPKQGSDLAKMAKEVAKEVEALRGWTFKKPVANRFATPADVRNYLEKELAEQTPPEKIRRIETLLRMVGLVPNECNLKQTFVDLLEEQVGGYYDTKTESLRLVKRDTPLPPLIQRVMLAHELTHALDDQHVDLEAFLERMGGQTEDRDLVAMSVVEGSATALMTRYMTRAALSGRFEQGEVQAYANREMKRSKRLLDAPRYFTAMLGAYVCGMQFLCHGDPMAMLGGKGKTVGEHLKAATKEPPESMEQILHPEKYWDEATRDAPIVLDDAAVTKILQGDGRWVVHTDTLGELLIAILTTPPGVRPSLMSMGVPAMWTNDGAKGWGGDRLYLSAEGPDAKTAARDPKQPRGLWLTVWDTPRDRDEFRRAYERRPPQVPRAVVPFGTLGVAVLFGFEQQEAEAMVDRLRKASLPMTRGDEPWSPWAL